MFPIPWNFPLRKKNGNLVNIGDAIDEGSELPEHGEGDAGKVLSVNESGNLEWSDEVNTEIQTLTNKLDDEVETRAKLGAHNLFNINAYSNLRNIEITNDVITNTDTDTATALLPKLMIYNSVSQTSEHVIAEYTWPSVTAEGIYSCNITIPDGAQLLVFKHNGVTHNFQWEGNFTMSGDIVFSFKVTGYDCSTIGGVIIEKVMLSLASDLSTEYTEYAMTNRELTDKVAVKNVTITPATGVTFDYNGTYKIGNLVILTFRFILDASFTVATDAPIATIDAVPLDSSILAPAATAWDGEVGGLLGIMNNNVIKLAASSHFVANKSYVVNATYVCK